MKRTLAILLCLMMLISCAACGNSSTPSSTPSTPSSTPSSTSGTSTTEPKQEASSNEDRHYAVDKDTVVVCTADETPSVTARLHNATAGSYVNYLTYEGLLTLDRNLAP